MSKFDAVEVGKRIKAKREEHGFTQEALAREIGIASKQIYRIEKGEQVMSAEILLEFALFFGLTTDWIVKGKESNSHNSNEDGVLAKDGT